MNEFINKCTRIQSANGCHCFDCRAKRAAGVRASRARTKAENAKWNQFMNEWKTQGEI